MTEFYKGIDADFKDRITLDIDSKNSIKTHYIAYKLSKHPNYLGSKIKKSNSKGFHIIIYYDKVLNKAEKEQIRNKYDDKLRQHYDKTEKPKQILFKQKYKNYKLLKK